MQSRKKICWGKKEKKQELRLFENEADKHPDTKIALLQLKRYDERIKKFRSKIEANY